MFIPVRHFSSDVSRPGYKCIEAGLFPLPGCYSGNSGNNPGRFSQKLFRLIYRSFPGIDIHFFLCPVSQGDPGSSPVDHKQEMRGIGPGLRVSPAFRS